MYVTYNGSYERCVKDEEAVEEMLEENTGAETEKMEKMKEWKLQNLDKAWQGKAGKLLIA